MKDYKAIQELSNVIFEAGGFNTPQFKITKSSSLGERARKVKLFTCDRLNVLWFDYSFESYSKVYIRFKGNKIYPSIPEVAQLSDVYLEMPGFSGGASCGDKENSCGQNPWAKYLKTIDLYRNGSKAMISIGGGTDFEFITNTVIVDEISHELTFPYIKLPSNIYQIDYMSYDVDHNIFCVAHPKFNFGYDTMEAWYITHTGNVIKCEVDKVERFRDGGTTNIFLKKDGEKFVFHSPTTFSKNQSPTWNLGDGDEYNGQKMSQKALNREMFETVVSQLGLILEIDDYQNPQVISKE